MASGKRGRYGSVPREVWPGCQIYMPPSVPVPDASWWASLSSNVSHWKVLSAMIVCWSCLAFMCRVQCGTSFQKMLLAGLFGSWMRHPKSSVFIIDSFWH